MTLRKKKVIAISLSAVVIVVGLLALIYFQTKSIGRIMQRLDLAKEGMSERDIIGLLGEPKAQKWVESGSLNLPDKIKDKYRRVYVYYYEFGTFMNKLFLGKLFPSRGVISTFIVFNAKNGKVIAETGRSIADIGMIKFIEPDKK